MPVAILGVLVIALIKLAKTLRKWATGGSDLDANLGNFSIDQLRKMRSQGKLTETEYEHAKAAVIEQSRHMLDD